MRGPSWLPTFVYVRDGAVNDDIGGAHDGDFFTVTSDWPVTVSMATDSDWQHDFSPSVGRRAFFIHTIGRSGNAHDLNPNLGPRRYLGSPRCQFGRHSPPAR